LEEEVRIYPPSKGLSFKDTLNKKTSIVVPTRHPNVYIMEKLEEVPIFKET
jgi:hypothetical protein